MNKTGKWSNEQKEALYWRYKKKTPPKEETPELNGPVIVKKPKLPPAFKCSKCDHVASNRKDFKDHWELEH